MASTPIDKQKRKSEPRAFKRQPYSFLPLYARWPSSTQGYQYRRFHELNSDSFSRNWRLMFRASIL